jgi:processive 1,2-diacylglycerol beta-glucosyltransferase
MIDKNYRLLVLTSSTGGGHDARADALAAWAEKIYGDKIRTWIFHPLEETGAPLGNFGVWLYNFIQRYAPVLHAVYFEIIEIIGDFQKKKFIGREKYEALLKAFQPQMIVSVHDFLNRGYFDLAHELLGDDVRCATYCGEYAGGDGFSKHWACARADRWVGRTERAVREAYRLGVDPEKLGTFTFFLPPDELSAMEPPPSRRELRLDEKKLTILFANGRNGAFDHMRYLKALEPFKDRAQVIVVCGMNERLRQAVDRWQEETKFPGIVEGFSSRLRAYTRLSDVVIFRGGANTATRAFYEGCPMWFDASEGVMPQEHLTIDFFLGIGAGELVSGPKELVEKVEAELSGRGNLPALRERMTSARQKYNQPPPDEFFREFLGWGLRSDEKEVERERIENQAF